MLRIHWFIFPNRYFLSGHGAKSSSPSDTNYPLVWKHAQQWNISISNRQPTNGGLSIYFKFDSSEIVVTKHFESMACRRFSMIFPCFSIQHLHGFDKKKHGNPPTSHRRGGGDLDEVRRLRKIIAELEAA